MARQATLGLGFPLGGVWLLSLVGLACGGSSYDPGESTPGACQDSLDNDGDGNTDCSDPDCQGYVFCGGGGESTAPACGDNQDNDGDGHTDCADADCAGFVFCVAPTEDTATACQDHADNDVDGDTDCADTDCQGFVFCALGEADATACDDGLDNDSDGQTDCEDAGCLSFPHCVVPHEDTPALCQDLLDNDNDTRFDCADTDCQGFVFCMAPAEDTATLCRNGRDDDGDLQADCADADCQGFVFCQAAQENDSATCRNGLDDDADGDTDCGDADCQGFVFCFSTDETTAITCQDLVDNDTDTLIDCDDPDCQGFLFCAENAETSTIACQDGQDNDTDGATDCDDPDCQGYVFCQSDESTAAACQDGLDNDTDGQTDCQDPECQGFVFCVSTENDATACQNGLDDDGDGGVDCEDLDCSGFVFCQALENSAVLCQDNQDNDQDGWIDCADPDCQGFVFCQTVENTAAACQDSQDNDSDGATDCDDGDCQGFVFCFQSGEESGYDACRDGVDNDGDGAQDCADEGCWPWGFCQHYNGYPVVDSWGETWDGIERQAKTYALAEAECQALGGRLPTATELWRNNATTGSGDLSDTNAANYLWTLIRNYQANRLVIARLSDGSLSSQDAAATAKYRCVWPDAVGLGYDEARCHGAPGATCFAFQRFWNADTRDRAPLDYAAATNECAFYQASIPVSSEWSRLIHAGLPNGSNSYLWVGKAIYWYNGGYGNPIVRWLDVDRANWMFWQGGLGWGSLDYGYNARPFRCLGLVQADRFPAPTPSACNGACFALTSRRSPAVADDTDRATARYSAALGDCRAQGADLPNLADTTELIHAGWPNGTNAWMWGADPEYWYNSGYGYPVHKWTGAGVPHWIFDPTNGGLSWATDPRSYRCVWHPQGPAVPACQAGQVVTWDGDAFGCQDGEVGSSGGNAYVIEIIDDWGNAWDGIQRASSSSYQDARVLCESLGGRLPTASELYAVRATGNPHDPIGDVTSTSYLWTGSPVYQTGERSLVRISDGGATHAVESSAQFFRCIWPATRSEVLAGRNCYGPPGDECFRTADGLIMDRYDRTAVDVATAAHECLQAGGHLPDQREFAKLMHSGAQNGSNAYLWLDEFVYWYSGNYGYALGRWIGDGLPDWEFDNGPRGAVSFGYEYRPFRCVYDRLIR